MASPQVRARKAIIKSLWAYWSLAHTQIGQGRYSSVGRRACAGVGDVCIHVVFRLAACTGGQEEAKEDKELSSPVLAGVCSLCHAGTVWNIRIKASV